MVGEKRGVLMREGGSEMFDDILGKGSELLHQSTRKMYNKPPITPTISDY